MVYKISTVKLNRFPKSLIAKLVPISFSLPLQALIKNVGFDEKLIIYWALLFLLFMWQVLRVLTHSLGTLWECRISATYPRGCCQLLPNQRLSYGRLGIHNRNDIIVERWSHCNDIMGLEIKPYIRTIQCGISKSSPAIFVTMFRKLQVAFIQRSLLRYWTEVYRRYLVAIFMETFTTWMESISKNLIFPKN